MNSVNSDPAVGQSEISAVVPPVMETIAPTTNLPAHSPLGASSSERWIHCPGSVRLIELVRTVERQEEDPDYRRDGIQAHALAAWCLKNDAEPWEAPNDLTPNLTQEMFDAVQVYLDFVATLPEGQRIVEHFFHRPDLHPQCYGTVDVGIISATIDIVDYKHGEGVYVPVENNPQIMYYTYCLIGEDRKRFLDDMRVRLHICQPRFPGTEAVRSWETTAGAIRQWAHDILLPAMNRIAHEQFLSMGEWCRFCPAKVVCPAMACLGDELVYKSERSLQTLDPDALGRWYEKAQIVRMFIKAIETETQRRVLAGVEVPGVKAVAKKADRVWKDDVPLEATFQADAWEIPKLRSPAQVEKLDGGKSFVAEWAYKPDTGLTVALANDKRPAVSVKSGAETFAIALQGIDNSPAEEY